MYSESYTCQLTPTNVQQAQAGQDFETFGASWWYVLHSGKCIEGEMKCNSCPGVLAMDPCCYTQMAGAIFEA